jgi:DNA-binding FrmR family transcriptional regulator
MIKDMKRKSEKQIQQLLQTAQGQLQAIIAMYNEQAYCVDIANQILAVNALLKKANNLIVHDHIEMCVNDAVDVKVQKKKLDEIGLLLKKLNQ